MKTLPGLNWSRIWTYTLVWSAIGITGGIAGKSMGWWG